MSVKISRILHAGYTFEGNSQRIAFDPIFENPFSVNCYAYPPVDFDLEQIRNLTLDAVFISHFHEDHCSLESLNLLKKNTPIYMFCVFDEIFDWIRQLGFTEVYPLILNQSVQVGEFIITPRRALDEDVDSIFHIQVQGLNILNVVDSWIDYETLDLLKETRWDLVMWPFQTMREIEVLSPRRSEASDGRLPVEWVEQLQELNPRNIIPSSCQFSMEPWSWYNQAFFPVTYAGFSRQVQEAIPQSNIVRLNPGCSIRLTKSELAKTESLEWIFPVGSQDLDYEYDPNLVPPSTAEIAQRFPELDLSGKERVQNFCRSDIIQRYASLSHSEEGYFSLPRIWKLLIYDHLGKPLQFTYKIDGGAMTHVGDDLECSWLTEVSECKLFGALEEGESLTSIYLRINDKKFSSEIESDISEADLMEDPLMRCLFNGEFGTYQREQLKRIKASVEIDSRSSRK